MDKVFDFNLNSNPCGIIGTPHECAWPCHMFRVTLPEVSQKNEDDLNAFEWCVLKLLAYGCSDPSELAEETCLPADLIQSVLLHLYDRSKIDQHYQVLPDVLTEIKRLDSKEDIEPEKYETYVIFRDLIGQKILPMLEKAKIKSEEINEDGSIKKGKKNSHLQYLSAPKGVPLSPTIPDVFFCLRTMKRRCKVIGEQYSIPPAKFISIIPQPEPCRLRVRMVIQRNTDWRIVNPFGQGWSQELESVYQKLLGENSNETESFKNWQKSNSKKYSVKENDSSRKSQPFDTDENRSRYPQLITTLNRKEVDLYAALEWTLFYALKRTDTKAIIQLLQIDTAENNQVRLTEAIRELVGKNQKDDTTHLRQNYWISLPLQGKLDAFINDGMAEMQVVLPLAILVSQNDSHLDLDQILENYPDCLEKIGKLKQLRDAKRHGRSKWSQIYGEDDRKFMEKFISILLPSIRFSEDEPEEKANEASLDIRFNARLTLQDCFFDLSSFDRMESNLQNYLIQAEMFRELHTIFPKGKKDGEEKSEYRFDALPCINYLCAAVQCAFRPLLTGIRPESDSIETPSKKVHDCGLGELPMSLRMVRRNMLQMTLNGNDQTLGASVLAWILQSDTQILQQVAQKDPSFLSDIDNLLNLDKHGNQICMMKSADLDILCKSIYKLIRTITEA